jgi:hypothetical protein
VTYDEAAQIRELLTGLYLAGTNNYDTPFDKKLIERSHIIVLQDVIELVESGKTLEAQTIKGLQAANLLEPVTITEPPPHAAFTVKAAMEKAGAAAKAAVATYMAKHGKEGGYCGWANATTYEVTSPIVQYLLNNDGASGPFDGCVHIDFSRDYPASQSLDHNEAGVEVACKVLSE